MRTNTKPARPRTHEGAPAHHIGALAELRRSVLSTMLFEGTFYEDGEDIAKRIRRLAGECKPEEVAALAVEARNDYKLRHAPLWLTLGLVPHGGKIVEDTLYTVLQRADEPGEFLSMYWRDGKKPIPAAVKRGLGRALGKFDEYQLAKYSRANDAVCPRDVLFLTHPKPKSPEQEALWKRLADDTLAKPDTWEVALSEGGDKKAEFERLLREGKLGYMALLRNLRNMVDVGVGTNIIKTALLEGAPRSRVLPFRFISAAKAAPSLEPTLDEAMQGALPALGRLPGRTAIVVDVSASMGAEVSGRSTITRMDAACALAILARGISDEARVVSFSWGVVEVPAREGMALRDAIVNSQRHGGTDLGAAVRHANRMDVDRVIVITDEQSHTRVPDSTKRGYVINVASYQHGVGYGKWVHIDGFSEAAVRFIQEYEAIDTEA